MEPRPSWSGWRHIIWYTQHDRPELGVSCSSLPLPPVFTCVSTHKRTLQAENDPINSAFQGRGRRAVRRVNGPYQDCKPFFRRLRLMYTPLPTPYPPLSPSPTPPPSPPGHCGVGDVFGCKRDFFQLQQGISVVFAITSKQLSLSNSRRETDFSISRDAEERKSSSLSLLF